MAHNSVKLLLLAGCLGLSCMCFAETPGEEAARVQRELEEQRLEPVSPPQITINQYRYQMQLEQRLRQQQQLINNMEKQVQQLRRSSRNNENE